ncbi:hypothetical protein ACN28E_49315 [Archangium lansingense]|uniref:hypothetical protein n=1 Tax=Archangium lansingense TaxID=2995310 RepID=UPI003B81496D
MQKSELVALVDMDGTLCDYEGTMARDMEKLRSPGDPAVFPDDEHENPWVRERRSLIRRQSGWWRHLPKLKLGFDVLGELQAQHFEVHVLTKGPVAAPSAWTEKLEVVPGAPARHTRHHHHGQGARLREGARR